MVGWGFFFPSSPQANVLLEGLIAKTLNSIRKSVFYGIAWKLLRRCLAELPFLADNTQSFARNDAWLQEPPAAEIVFLATPRVLPYGFCAWAWLCGG